MSKPIQSAPTFNRGLQNPMSAQLYYLKAKQAYADQQWQEVCTFARMSIAAVGQDRQVKFLATELLAESLLKIKQIEPALAGFMELDRLKPNHAEILYNIGSLLIYLRRYEEAIGYLQRVIKILPEYANGHVNLGLACFEHGEIAQAKDCYRQAMKINPQLTEAKYYLGVAFQTEGCVDEARQIFEEVLTVMPQSLSTLGNLIFMQHNCYPLDMDHQKELLQRYARQVEDDLVNPSTVPILLQSHTPLRVGIVSADFRFHAVALFLESTLTHIAANSDLRDRLTLVAYDNGSNHDQYTQLLRAKFDLWHQVESWADDRLISQISQDRIDLLIDLSGHTAGTRLPVFAKRAAPLQVSWLGYWGSTGLAQMDYVLADSISVPIQEAHWFTEKIWRLPHLRYCFSIPVGEQEVSPAPCLQSPQIVFGCYQAFTKINHAVMRCWLKILERCPQARLRIQVRQFEKSELKDRFIEQLTQLGFDLRRVELVGIMSHNAYLASYAEVDIVLDTFPYPGGTTTVQALWMGVPTITLASPSMLGRQGEALMVNAGLSDWVVYSEEDYIQKAIAWGHADLQQRQALATLRMNMREQVRHSPVFNAEQFAGEFVDALYGMWREKWGEKATFIPLKN